MFYCEYHDIIKEIGTDPLFIPFYTQAQRFVFNQNSKKGRTVISIDATGGLVSNRELVADLSKKVDLPHIFLYLICLKMQDEKSIPIAQCLSAQQDTRKIKNFVELFIEDFGYPHEVIMDEGTALQKACAISFNKCDDIAEYV